MNLDDNTPKPKRKDTGPILFLSLFLLLLAFFILLNALSTFEETKSRQVIRSVASTFQTRVRPQNAREILVSTLGPVPKPAEVMAEVERLWITAIPLTKVKELTPGSTMQFDVPATELFLGGETVLREDRSDLLKGLALALAARMEGYRSEVQIVGRVGNIQNVRTTGGEQAQAAAPAEAQPLLNLDDPTETVDVETGTDRRNISYARMINLAEAVVAKGAPETGVSIGLLQGDPNRIRMRFYIHPEDKAYNRFLDVEE